MISRCTISDCGKYRYLLVRIWDEGKPILVFVMLNPSTADERKNDPTLNACIAFASRHGYGGVMIVNLYAYRASKPHKLLRAVDPYGPENVQAIGSAVQYARTAGTPIVCAWGANQCAVDDRRSRSILYRSGVRLVCLGTTKEGHPLHPLYVPREQQLLPFLQVMNGARQ